MDEVANSLYVAVADDHQGTKVTRQGWAFTDKEVGALLAAVKEEAADITHRRRHAAERG